MRVCNVGVIEMEKFGVCLAELSTSTEVVVRNPFLQAVWRTACVWWPVEIKFFTGR